MHIIGIVYISGIVAMAAAVLLATLPSARQRTSLVRVERRRDPR